MEPLDLTQRPWGAMEGETGKGSRQVDALTPRALVKRGPLGPTPESLALGRGAGSAGGGGGLGMFISNRFPSHAAAGEWGPGLGPGVWRVVGARGGRVWAPGTCRLGPSLRTARR